MLYPVALNLPGLIDLRKWNIIAQYVQKTDVLDRWQPRSISVIFSKKLNINQVDDLKYALEAYKDWFVCDFTVWPHTWGRRYFLLKFKTFNNLNTVITDINRIISAGKITNFTTGQTQNNLIIPTSIPKSPVVTKTVTSKNKTAKILESIKPYQNYIIAALAVLVLFLIIKKK